MKEDDQHIMLQHAQVQKINQLTNIFAGVIAATCKIKCFRVSNDTVNVSIFELHKLTNVPNKAAGTVGETSTIPNTENIKNKPPAISAIPVQIV